jgi:hypothetical protein
VAAYDLSPRQVLPIFVKVNSDIIKSRPVSEYAAHRYMAVFVAIAIATQTHQIWLYFMTRGISAGTELTKATGGPAPAPQQHLPDQPSTGCNDSPQEHINAARQVANIMHVGTLQRSLPWRN